MRVAALDCGTNSLKLLVADLDPATGEQTDVVREEQLVRLGEGVDRTGALAPQALRRTLEACDAYAAQIAELGAQRLGAAATSAGRDARNGAELVAGIRRRLGVTPLVVDGVTEARLSYAGAARGLAAAADADLLLVDVGGGSTELVRGRGLDVLAVESTDVGCVRITERHLASDPATAVEVAAASADIDEALDTVSVPLDRPDSVVVVSGTAMTVAAHTLGLDRLDPDRLHGARLDLDEVRRSCAALLAAPLVRRRELGFMHPGRADVIGGGALVLDRVLARVRGHDGRQAPRIVPSTHDVLDGIAWSLL